MLSYCGVYVARITYWLVFVPRIVPNVLGSEPYA